MTFEEHVNNTKDIKQLRYELIEYNRFLLGFEAYLTEQLGKEQFEKLCSGYTKFRANAWLREVMQENKA